MLSRLTRLPLRLFSETTPAIRAASNLDRLAEQVQPNISAKELAALQDYAES